MEGGWSETVTGYALLLQIARCVLTKISLSVGSPPVDIPPLMPRVQQTCYDSLLHHHSEIPTSRNIIIVSSSVDTQKLVFHLNCIAGRCSINLSQQTWYVGCETGISPPSEYCFTLRDQSKEEQFRVFRFVCLFVSLFVSLCFQVYQISSMVPRESI